MAPSDNLRGECLGQQNPNDEEARRTRNHHGRTLYHRQTGEVADTEKSHQWLEKAGLKDSPEALTTAAQAQALSVKSIEVAVNHTRQDPGCRLCKDAPEMVQHITARCKMQAVAAHMEQHNQVVHIVYRNISAEYGWKSHSQDERHLQRWLRMAVPM